MAPRMTIPTQLVLRALLDAANDEHYGLELASTSGLPSGTIHPILARLEGLRWVESRWEDVDPSAAGRPARRYYRLTADGATQARAALHQAEQRRRSLTARPSGSPA